MRTAGAKAFETADVIHAICACANDGCSVFSSAFSSVLVGRTGKTLQEKVYCGREALDAFSVKRKRNSSEIFFSNEFAVNASTN